MLADFVSMSRAKFRFNEIRASESSLVKWAATQSLIASLPRPHREIPHPSKALLRAGAGRPISPARRLHHIEPVLLARAIRARVTKTNVVDGVGRCARKPIGRRASSSGGVAVENASSVGNLRAMASYSVTSRNAISLASSRPICPPHSFWYSSMNSSRGLVSDAHYPSVGSIGTLRQTQPYASQARTRTCRIWSHNLLFTRRLCRFIRVCSLPVHSSCKG